MAATSALLDKVDVLGPKPTNPNLQADYDLAPPPAPAFDPDALKAKYLAERDKRLKHGGGIDQYRLVDEDGQFRHYLDDPWVNPGFCREPVDETVDVVVVGGGYGAQLVAVRLMERGIKNVRLIEKAGGFG